MELSALRYFIEVCRQKSITKAAAKLFISKQALSHVMIKLESEINAPLFIRTPSGVEPTEAGQRFYLCAVEIEQSWTRCLNDIQSATRAQAVDLRVGFGYMSYLLWTKEMDEDFARHNPDISLTAVGRLSRELLAELDAKRLDAVITCMQGDQYARYDRALIQKRPLIVVMSSDDPLAQRKVITPYDLDGRKVFYADSGTRFMADVAAFFQSLGLNIQVRFCPAGNFFASLKAARDEQGVLLSNDVFQQVTPAIDGFLIKPLRYDGEGDIHLPACRIYALYGKDAPNNPALERFIRYLRSALESVTARGPAAGAR